MTQKSRHVLLFMIAILLLAALLVFSAAQILEALLTTSQTEQPLQASKTIVRNGLEYFPRQDITVILLIGTDREGKAESSGSYNNKASADMVALLIFDETAKECTLLTVNRDTMMDIPILGLNSEPAGTTYAQLATSHNYGSGLDDSCENTKKAVSDFFYGLTIDYYFSLGMDGIRLLNDAVGGVEVTIEDDFSAVDPSLKQGSTIVLNGDQALSFVRSRMNVGTQLNLSRMARQEQYMEGFVAALHDNLDANALFMNDLWTQLSEYMITDCSTTVLNRLASDYSDYVFVRTVSPEGENIMGEKYYEFYVDEEKLDALILELFYELKDPKR